MQHEPHKYTQYARRLRRKQTQAEHAMWSMFRGRRFMGLKFRRQHEIGYYIVDFYCEQLKLAIELDGARHFDADAIEFDAERTQWLQAQGITVTRVENNELLLNPWFVERRLMALVRELRTLA